MTISDEISTLANQIANKGNKPTVALIKAKLKKSVPLPIIISALKNWQHEPNFVSLPKSNADINNIEQTNASSNTDSFEALLHNELTSMKGEIQELKALVQDLIKQQKTN